MLRFLFGLTVGFLAAWFVGQDSNRKVSQRVRELADEATTRAQEAGKDLSGRARAMGDDIRRGTHRASGDTGTAFEREAYSE